MRILILIAILFSSVPAFAGGIAVVDFQQALNDVQEGKLASARLDGMFAEKQGAVKRLEGQLQGLVDEYEKQKLILSADTRMAKEQAIMELQRTYQMTAMQAEQEMQAAYASSMEGLITKLRIMAEAMGKEKSYDIVIEVTEGGIVYWGGAADITAELIKRYNAANPG
jgi:Skp family chaperone for outer membrane proteins